MRLSAHALVAVVWSACWLFEGAGAWVTTNLPPASLTASTTRRRRHSALAAKATGAGTGNRNNVVLEPSFDDESAFDSLKIGNARVHRYSREDDPDSQTEYVMWYHGRSLSDEKNEDANNIPPLSTGRIGRATSRNGLHWSKDTTGSASEDREGVSLGINKDSWWGFDTCHVGLGNVLLPMTTPAVLTDGGVYLMYYMGGSHEENLVANYIENDLPDNMKDATLKGMTMKIGVCLSQDGITWGRVEGDDHTGAVIVPYDRDCPNQQASGYVPVDAEEELYCAWPEVVVNIGGGNTKRDKDDDNFIMFYSTMTKDTKQKCIAYAESEDGFRWDKKGICLRPSSDGPDAGGCARCCVIRDSIWDKTKQTWTEAEDASWTMYYEGVSPKDNKHRIMVATSTDHKTWKKKGVVFDVGQENRDDWDAGGVGSPHVIRMDDGNMRLYYTGQGLNGSTAIGVAKLNAATGLWEREQATVTFATDIAD